MSEHPEEKRIVRTARNNFILQIVEACAKDDTGEIEESSEILKQLQQDHGIDEFMVNDICSAIIYIAEQRVKNQGHIHKWELIPNSNYFKCRCGEPAPFVRG